MIFGALTLIAKFAVYSFAGWLLEVHYRSWTQHRFVNPGLLRGPYLPIYGFGGLLTALATRALAPYSPLLLFVVLGLVLSALEYMTGWCLERVLGLRLWDYRGSRLHLHGRVSLSFSVAWAALATVFGLFGEPWVTAHVEALDPLLLASLVGVFCGLVLFDGWSSAKSVLELSHLVRVLDAYAHLPLELEARLQRFVRLFRAFPDLQSLVEAKAQTRERLIRIMETGRRVVTESMNRLRK